MRERYGIDSMGNAILFANSFLSYLLLMAIIAGIAGVGIFIGIRLRKNKNAGEKENGETAES